MDTKKTPTLRWRLAQWLEIRWWRNYLADKPTGDYLAQKADYWQRLLDALKVTVPAQTRVLDAGCGPAGIFLIMPTQTVDAVDPLLAKYEAEITHFEPTAYANVQFHSMPLEDFRTEKAYDTVFCLNAINHVNDWERGLDQLTTATRTGGQLVLGIDVHNHSWLKFIFQRLPGDVLHPHQHDRDDYRAALARRGWVIEGEHTWKKGGIFDYWLVTARKTEV